jgi:hypothetical protein
MSSQPCPSVTEQPTRPHHSQSTQDCDQRGSCPSCPLLTLGDEIRKILSSIFSKRPYWSRRWVVQESLVARETRVICGFHNLSFDFIRVVRPHLSWLSSAKHSSSKVYQLALAFIGPARFNVANQYLDRQKRADLNLLISTFKYQKCSNTRDIIYSLLGLSHLEGIITPDYDTSLGELFFSVGKALIWRKRPLDVICVLEFEDGGNPGNNDEYGEKPSWVPNWTIPENSFEWRDRADLRIQ